MGAETNAPPTMGINPMIAGSKAMTSRISFRVDRNPSRIWFIRPVSFKRLLKKRILTKAPMIKSVFVSTIEEATSIEIFVMGRRKRIPSKKVANKRLSQRLIFRYIRTMMTAKTIPILTNSTTTDFLPFLNFAPSPYPSPQWGEGRVRGELLS
jgi:hypothetical protein